MSHPGLSGLLAGIKQCLGKSRDGVVTTFGEPIFTPEWKRYGTDNSIEGEYRQYVYSSKYTDDFLIRLIGNNPAFSFERVADDSALSSVRPALKFSFVFKKGQDEACAAFIEFDNPWSVTIRNGNVASVSAARVMQFLDLVPKADRSTLSPNDLLYVWLNDLHTEQVQPYALLGEYVVGAVNVRAQFRGLPYCSVVSQKFSTEKDRRVETISWTPGISQNWESLSVDSLLVGDPMAMPKETNQAYFSKSDPEFSKTWIPLKNVASFVYER